MSIYLKMFMTAILLTSSACSSRSEADSSSAPRVLVDAPKVGVRCALASIYYQFDAVRGGDKLATSILPSPDGRQLAFMDPRGVRVFVLSTGAELLIEGVRPVMWSRDSRRLYVIAGTLRFYSYADKRLSPEPWLDKTFGAALHAGQDIARPDLLVAGHGLVAVPRAAARILVANVEERSTFSVLVGARWMSPRPYSGIAVGWNSDRDEPALFVMHQAINGDTRAGSNPDAIDIANRVDVYRPNGDHDFGAEVKGSEVSLVPLLRGKRALVLARAAEHRCLHAIGEERTLSPLGACDVDLDTVNVDRRGQRIAAKTFLEREPHNELAFGTPGESSSARLLGLLGDGTSLHLLRTPTGVDEVVTVRDRTIRSRRPLPPRECVDRESFPRGRPLSASAADGFTAQGFLFVPAAGVTARGLVVQLHGGPREAHPDSLVNAFGRGVLERGYAIVTVNYRGSTGYGRALLEKPYGGGYDGMLADAAALRHAALGELRLPASAPVVLRGISYGGYLAIKAAVERGDSYGAFIIESAVCHPATSPGDVSYGSPEALPLTRVTDPDYSLHSLRIATGADGKPAARDFCSSRATGHSRLVVIHSQGDLVAPFIHVKKFADAQDKSRLLTIFADGFSHDPLSALSVDRNNFGLIVDQTVRFIEAPPGSPP